MKYRLLFPFFAIILLGACEPPREPPPSPPVQGLGDNRYWVVHAHMVYKIGNSDKSIVVPEGFITDYASIPKFLWQLYSPHDQYSRAAIVHDYLYWTQLCTRKQADNLFLIAMIESNVPKKTRNKVFWGVDEFGEDPWIENAKLRKNGEIRIAPPAVFGKLDPNLTWKEISAQLKRDGVKEVGIKDVGDYCSLGDKVEVPNQAKDQ